MNFSQAPTFEREFITERPHSSQLSCMYFYVMYSQLYLVIVIFSDTNINTIFSDSNTQDAVLFIQILHTNVQSSKELFLQAFLKPQKMLSAWYYFFHILLCALKESTFYHVCPYVLRGSPPSCPTEITLKPEKKINLLL